MIPLSIFIAIWLILLGIYGILALISIIQMVRYSLAGTGTYLSTAVYIIVAAVVIFGTILYLLTIDWNIALDLHRLLPASFNMSPS